MSKAVDSEGAVMRLDVKLAFDIRCNLRIHGTFPLAIFGYDLFLSLFLIPFYADYFSFFISDS
jgi:hypothetical protein